MLILPPILVFMGDTQLRKKKYSENNQPSGVFSEGSEIG